MNVYIDNNDCRISYDYRGGRTSVFCFTGVGLAMGGIESTDIQKEEFRKSLDGTTANCIYMIDKKRTWYASETLRSAAKAFMEEVHGTWTVEHVVSIGNSMGGTGAIAFSTIVNQNMTLSFAPQSTVSPAAAPFENRYAKYTGLLAADHQHTDIAESTFTENTFILYGVDSPIDLLHAERLIRAGYAVYLVRKCDHAIAAHLKKSGALSDIIERSLLGQTASVEKYIRERIDIMHPDHVPDYIQFQKIAHGLRRDPRERAAALQRLSQSIRARDPIPEQ